jgi:translation initiation factor IF-3
VSGREIAHRSEAEKTINKFVEDLKSLGTAEKRAGMEGRVLYVSINPLPGMNVCMYVVCMNE